MRRRTVGLLTILVLAVGAGLGYAYYNNINLNLMLAKLVQPVDKQDDKPKFSKTDIRMDGRIVHIMAGSGARGTGAVIGPYSIITVAHVVEDQDMVMVDVGLHDFVWRGARVVGFLKGSPEDIVLLQLLGDEPIEGKYFRLKTGYQQPSYVVTHRGIFMWQPGVITPGDSGSPILNPSGDVIGLVHGYYIATRVGIIATFRRPAWKRPTFEFPIPLPPAPQPEPEKAEK